MEGLPQPHWQFISWQRQAPFSHPHEQVPHPQLQFAAFVAVFFVVTFLTLDIVFFSFLFALLRFHRS